jgi:hypothetical protein
MLAVRYVPWRDWKAQHSSQRIVKTTILIIHDKLVFALWRSVDEGHERQLTRGKARILHIR